MSRKKELFNADFKKFVGWVGTYQNIPSNTRGDIVKSALADMLKVSKSAINDFEAKGVPMSTIMRFARERGASLFGRVIKVFRDV